MKRELTGRHVLAIAVTAFGVIIGVNLLLAWQAVATFPGIEVRNGYVASQSFEANRKAQEALGWDVATRIDGRMLQVEFSGPNGGPAPVASVEGLFGRATSTVDDQALAFRRTDRGLYEAEIDATRGQWVLQLRAEADDGTPFRQRVSVSVRD